MVTQATLAAELTPCKPQEAFWNPSLWLIRTGRGCGVQGSVWCGVTLTIAKDGSVGGTFPQAGWALSGGWLPQAPSTPAVSCPQPVAGVCFCVPQLGHLVIGVYRPVTTMQLVCATDAQRLTQRCETCMWQVAELIKKQQEDKFQKVKALVDAKVRPGRSSRRDGHV